MNICSQKKSTETTERILKMEAGIDRQRDGLADVVSATCTKETFPSKTLFSSACTSTQLVDCAHLLGLVISF
jgi:hypothetical protein